MEGHEFQYFRSPGGDEFILRRKVRSVVSTGSVQRSTGSGYRTLDDLAAYVDDETVRGWISALQALGDELPFHPEVRFAVPGGGNWRVQATRKAGRRRTRQQEPCHTIHSLFDELENRTRNTIRVNGTEATFPQLSTPTELQARALALINERVPKIT